jgi:hypothetical protein
MIDVKEYISQLKELQNSWDTEVAHQDADDIICELLTKLGYQEVVDEYEKVPKWYA